MLPTLALALIISTTSARLTEKQTTDVDYAVQNRQRIIHEVNSNTSTWQAHTGRFAGQSYERFLRLGAGVLGGDPTENAAGLPIKTLLSLQDRTGIQLSDIPVRSHFFFFCLCNNQRRILF